MRPHRLSGRGTVCRVFVLAAAFVCGCSARTPGEPQINRPEQLCVLHVAGEYGGAAGYPVSPSWVIASSHQFAGRPAIAAVEGEPMMVGNFPIRFKLDRDQLAPQDDWLVLFGTKKRFTPDLIDPSITLAPDDRVLLGGFFLADKQVSRRQYWRIPPRVIQGRLIGIGLEGTEMRGLMLVEVPYGDYGGFSGGPAAKVDESGRPRIWGTCVRQGFVRVGFGRRYAIGVARLPEDLAQRQFVRSYGSPAVAAAPRKPTTQPAVVHVAAEHHLLAGFPVGRDRVITATKPLMPVEMAVIDGYPMRYVKSNPERTPIFSTGPGWLVLYGRGQDLDADPIDPDPSLRSGDGVLLGGYFLSDGDQSPVDFLDVRPTIIRGVWLGRWAASEGGEPLDWVSAPVNDYRAFLGGPAATYNEKDGLRVWGVIVDYRGRSLPRSPAVAMIGVARLGGDD